MDFAFFQTNHDRAAYLRNLEWRTPGLKMMVIGGEHLGSVEDASGQRSIRWFDPTDAPDGTCGFLGTHDGQSYGFVMVERVPTELEPMTLRELSLGLSATEASLAVHAVGIARWHKTHRFCSRCGAETDVSKAAHVRDCHNCGAVHFPRIDPAVIMLITDGADRALLGRQPSWPQNRFSTLAGFVEPGETLEDAVRREVMEEVGIKVADVAYAGSQPWPFPSSLMLGFFGTAQSVDIAVDDDEIAEARWFSRTEITGLTAAGELLLPPAVSVSRALVETWHGGEISGRWS